MADDQEKGFPVPVIITSTSKTAITIPAKCLMLVLFRLVHYIDETKFIKKQIYSGCRAYYTEKNEKWFCGQKKKFPKKSCFSRIIYENFFFLS